VQTTAKFSTAHQHLYSLYLHTQKHTQLEKYRKANNTSSSSSSSSSSASSSSSNNGGRALTKGTPRSLYSLLDDKSVDIETIKKLVLEMTDEVVQRLPPKTACFFLNRCLGQNFTPPATSGRNISMYAAEIIAWKKIGGKHNYRQILY